MNQKKFCSLELAQQLKEKGFDLPCDYIYANHYRVKDEIHEQYPGLSDDGYRELTDEWGGNLKEEEVYGYYVEPMKVFAKNTTQFMDSMPYMICTMPTLDDARTWLRDKYAFHIVITPESDYFRSLLILPNQFGFVGVGGATVQIYNPEVKPSDYKSTVFKGYEKALEIGLVEALKYVDKWNKV